MVLTKQHLSRNKMKTKLFPGIVWISRLIALLIISSLALNAADRWWETPANINDTWDTSAGWRDSLIPTSADNARITQNITVTSGIDAVAAGVFIGYSTGTHRLTMDGGSLTTNYMQFGHNWDFVGELYLSGGQIDVSGNLRLGFRHVSVIDISGGSMAVDSIYFGATGSDINITNGSLTLREANLTAEHWTSSQIAKTTISFGDSATSSGQFIAEFDWWDPTNLDQTVVADQIFNRMKSVVDGVDQFGANGVRWYYDNGNTVFEAIPEPQTTAFIVGILSIVFVTLRKRLR